MITPGWTITWSFFLKMLHKSVLCDNVQLPAIGADGTDDLPNELVNVIRSIVPPPPDEMFYSIAKVPDNTLSLFQRRPTEKILLQRGDDGSSFSAKDTETYLEDIFIQLVEPNKYSDGNKILHIVLDLMIRWKLDIAVQEQAFKCLVCLSQQCEDLEPPPPTTSSVLEAMKCFHRFEVIQRMGVKILKSKTFLDRMKTKVQVACLIFNSLCNLPEMDDFMLHAKEIVQELTPPERIQIRSCKQYVEMLLDFPNRKNDKVTVFLSWCALETLLLLAEPVVRWGVFIDIHGQDKLWRMSCRSELEDRCQALLNRILPPDKNHVLTDRNVRPLAIKSSDPVDLVHQPLTKATELSLREDTGNFNTDQTLKAGKVKNENFNQLQDRRTSSDLLPAGNAFKVLPVDDLIGSKPLTPPPTIPDIDDRVSDDEITCTQSSYSPLYRITSPSYSPPPETYASLERRFGATLSPPQKLNEDHVNTACTVNNRDRGVCHSANEEVSIKSAANGNKSEPHQKLSPKIVQCLFCHEPKAKRPLLVTQYNNLSHCLLEPRNSMLYKLFQSNLCDLHKMR
ncbi:uncharacterized protein LOC117653957 isoform X2 [Thrips palmi]|uniref:Uncharacterized protein LOC117653957 isoform X2 n=1 Tax=Thrips palmi TaxID=161013 RepID=A0A6P9ACK1_THRPL|nr:uncharacterized protein LOC117653957 isoform X2 [Thrips palmi]